MFAETIVKIKIQEDL